MTIDSMSIGMSIDGFMQTPADSQRQDLDILCGSSLCFKHSTMPVPSRFCRIQVSPLLQPLASSPTDPPSDPCPADSSLLEPLDLEGHLTLRSDTAGGPFPSRALQCNPSATRHSSAMRSGFLPAFFARKHDATQTATPSPPPRQHGRSSLRPVHGRIRSASDAPAHSVHLRHTPVAAPRHRHRPPRTASPGTRGLPSASPSPPSPRAPSAAPESGADPVPQHKTDHLETAHIYFAALCEIN